MRKLVIGLSMLLMLAVLAVGCTSNGTPKTEAAAADAGSTQAEGAPTLSGEISFSTWGNEQEIATNQKLIDTFEAKYPGTKVNLEAINDSYETTIETRYLGGQSPDVIYGHPRYFLPWSKQGMLMDISDVYEAHPEWFDEEVYMTNLYDSYKYDGKYYATVNGADTFLLFYNKDLIDSVGGEYPTENWTWEQLNELAIKCTTKNEDGTPKTFGFSTDEGGYFGLFAYIYENGGRVVDDVHNPKKVVINSPQTIEVLRNYQNKIYKDKSAPVADDWSYLTGGFAAGEFAMMTTGVWAIQYLADVTDFNWDIVKLPQHENSTTAVLYAGYAVSNQTKNPDLAKAFAAYMMSEEGQTILAETGLITVAHKKVASSDEVIKIKGAPPNHMLRVTSLEGSTNIEPLTTAFVEMIDTVVGPALDKLSNNQSTPEECAKEMEEGLQKMLDEANAEQ